MRRLIWTLLACVACTDGTFVGSKGSGASETENKPKDGERPTDRGEGVSGYLTSPEALAFQWIDGRLTARGSKGSIASDEGQPDQVALVVLAVSRSAFADVEATEVQGDLVGLGSPAADGSLDLTLPLDGVADPIVVRIGGSAASRSSPVVDQPANRIVSLFLDLEKSEGPELLDPALLAKLNQGGEVTAKLEIGGKSGATTVPFKEIAKATWISQNVQSCELTLDGAKLASGKEESAGVDVGSITRPVTVTLTCTGEKVAVSKVDVAPALSADQKLVFLTSDTFAADFGGEGGADQACASAAAAGKLPSAVAWKAILGATSAPKNRLNAAGRAFNLRGEDLGDLTALLQGGALTTKVGYDQLGSPVSSAPKDVWTGVLRTGDLDDDNCSGWTSVVDGSGSMVGNSGDLVSWLGGTTGGSETTCDVRARFYCVSQ